MNYIQQAYKGKNDWLNWVLTIIIVFIGWQVIGVLPITLVAFKQAGDLGTFIEAAEKNFMSMGMNSNLLFFLMLIMFLIGLVFLVIGVKYIHKRSFTSLVTSRKKIDWKRFLFGFVTWGLIGILSVLVGIYLAPENYTWNFKAIPFFTLLAISLVLLPFQTSFEELLFRGYFMQGIGVLAKNKWVPLFVTSVVFGLLHGTNPEVQKLGNIAMVFYIGTGFFYGITTLMDEGTELSLGLHAANNIVAAFFVTTDWTVFQTEALFIDTSEPSVGWEMFFPVLIIYPIMLFVFSKKYGWTNWNEKLFGTVDNPQHLQETTTPIDYLGKE